MYGYFLRIAKHIYSTSNGFISFLISTSLFLSVVGTFKIFFSELLYNIFNYDIIILTFLTTFSTYGLNKLTDLEEDTINTPERASTIKKIDSVFKFSVAISFILSLLFGFFVNILTLPVLFFPLFLGALYSIRLSSRLPRLKDITGVKNITVALSWAVVLTFLPIISLPKFNIVDTMFIFFLFFLKVV